MNDKMENELNAIRQRLQTRMDGGPGSGNHGHAGVPGQKGGSAPGGGIVSGANGDFSAKSDGAKRIDTKDAFSEGPIVDKTTGKVYQNSLKEHMDDKGNLSSERQALHRKIVQDMFKDKVSQEGQATMKMSGGGPASGKSFVWEDTKDSFGEETSIKIDPDEFKAKLPGYQEMAQESQMAAAVYHEESSALAKMAYQYAIDNNVNVVYDGTGDGSIRSVESKIDAARSAGYRVEGQYVTVDTDEAIKRNMARYQNGIEKYNSGQSDIPPRKVPDEYVRSCHAKVTDISVEVAQKFDSFSLYDNNGPRGSTPVKIAEASGGVIQATEGNNDKLQNYLNKGTNGLTVDSDGKVVK